MFFGARKQSSTDLDFSYFPLRQEPFSTMKSLIRKLSPQTYGTKGGFSTDEKMPMFFDDVFLVSYPRSGNTWLRFILANIVYDEANITFANIHRFSPETGRFEGLESNIRRPRFIKSHEAFNSSFPKVVYIVRDGRDVYVSYYHYLRNKLPAKMSFGDFLIEGAMPCGRWSDHIFSWLDNCVATPFLLVKYEDIHLKSEDTVQRVLDFMGLQVDDISMKCALEKATFHRMKELEITFGRGKYKTGPDTFMRKGRIGDWRNHFGENEKAIFKEKENEALVKLGYEKNAGW